MTVQWSSEILNRHLAPNYTEFTAATIPDLSERWPQAPHWLANFFLDSAFTVRYKAPLFQAVLGYLRRAHRAFSAFHEARLNTLAFLAGRDPYQAKAKGFYASVALWEEFALQVSMAMDLYNWLSKSLGSNAKAFAKGDGTKEQRLYAIANHIKHVGSCIDSGQCTDRDTLPLWLSNAGLESFGVSVSYSEASEILGDVASSAEILLQPIPAAK